MNAAIADTDVPINAAPNTRKMLLRPIHDKGGADWLLVLDGDMLTLTAPDERVVMMLPREDAVNHVRFLWDVLRGPVLLLEVIPGLKGYRFKKSATVQRTLLNWLPQRSESKLHRELRLHGVCMLVLTLALFQFSGVFSIAAVSLVNAAGILVLALPARRTVAISATMTALAGAWILYQTAFDANLARLGAYARPAATALGALFLLWGIQQYSLRGANHRLESARSEHPDGIAFPQPIGTTPWYAAGGACLLMTGLLAGIFWDVLQNGQPSAFDLALHAAPLLATLGMAVILFARAGRGLLEVKLSVQWLIVVVVVLAFGTWYGDPAPETSALEAGLRHLSRARVWLTAVALILAFNAWLRLWVEYMLGMKR